jgi:hypothetical protein
MEDSKTDRGADAGAWLLPTCRLYNHGLLLAGAHTKPWQRETPMGFQTKTPRTGRGAVAADAVFTRKG